MKILVGYDGSNAAKNALNLAKKHALAFGASVVVVYSMKKDLQTTSGNIEEAQKLLEYTKQFFSIDMIPIETHLLVRGFTPGEDLVEFAQEHQADEIVVGLKKTSPVGKMVFGSNARYVILNAHCPVVSVK
ncbi:MAG: universal stress protein [Desulfomonilaceae bacterium]